jgi:hypothetical protein
MQLTIKNVSIFIPKISFEVRLRIDRIRITVDPRRELRQWKRIARVGEAGRTPPRSDTALSRRSARMMNRSRTDRQSAGP